MSRVVPAKNICEQALRAIGSFPTTESAADGEHLRQAMTSLDLLLAQLAGTMRLFSRVDATLTMAITNGTQSYSLFSTLGSQLPTDRIQYVIDAWLEDGDGRRYEIEIVNRFKFEDVCKLAQTGRPEWAYIDRQFEPTLQIYPTPSSDDATSWSLKLVVQRYAPNVAPGGVTGTQPSGSVLHEMGQSWQRHLVFQLAHDLGSGLITKIGEQSLTRFKGIADEAKRALEAFENREHQTTAPICEAWGM